MDLITSHGPRPLSWEDGGLIAAQGLVRLEFHRFFDFLSFCFCWGEGGGTYTWYVGCKALQDGNIRHTRQAADLLPASAEGIADRTPSGPRTLRSAGPVDPGTLHSGLCQQAHVTEAITEMDTTIPKGTSHGFFRVGVRMVLSWLCSVAFMVGFVVGHLWW